MVPQLHNDQEYLKSKFVLGDTRLLFKAQPYYSHQFYNLVNCLILTFYVYLFRFSRHTTATINALWVKCPTTASGGQHQMYHGAQQVIDLSLTESQTRRRYDLTLESLLKEKTNWNRYFPFDYDLVSLEIIRPLEEESKLHHKGSTLELYTR